MKTFKHLFAIGLIAMLMSVSGLTSVSASAATAWNTSKPKMDIGVQSNAQNRTFSIKVYNKSGAKYYKILERGQDSSTGKWTSWKVVKGYYSFSGNYKRFTIAKSASDKKIYHYRLVCYNSNDEEVAIDKRLETVVPSSVKVTASNNSKTGKAQNTITWSGKVPTGFQLWRATSKNGTYHAMGGCIQANSYTDTSVTEGVTYYYKLRSYKKLASARYYSNFSSIVSVKTNENKIATPTVTSFTYDETNGFTVKYKSNTTSFNGFEVKIVDGSGKQVCYQQTDTNTTSVTLNSSDIKANTKYTVQVKAFLTVNGTKKYSGLASKDLTTPKQGVITEGDRPSVKDVKYNENCTYTDGSGDDGNGNLYYIFVGYSREFELSDENGKALSTSNTKVTVTENGTDKTNELVKVTSTSKGISIEPKKATSGKVTITFTRTDRKNLSVSYQYQFVQIADIPSSLNVWDLTRSYGERDGQPLNTTAANNERDSSRYALSQIKEQYSIWLNGKEDSLFNKLLYSYEVTTRTARYCEYEDELAWYRSNIYGALINHASSCDGSTATFEGIALMLGFPSNYLTVDGYGNMTGIHSYNMVTVDGKKWYKVDCDSDRYFDHQNGTPSYSSFMCGYYGFACSSQEEYDNAVAKVKEEFAAAINELNSENGYSLKVVDEKPVGATRMSSVKLEVSSGLDEKGRTIYEFLKNRIPTYLTYGYIYITSSLNINDYATSYTSQGKITYEIFVANTETDSETSNSVLPSKIVIDPDKITIVSEDGTEVIENNSSVSEDTEETVNSEVSEDVESYETEETSEVSEEVTEESSETSTSEVEAETSSEPITENTEPTE